MNISEIEQYKKQHSILFRPVLDIMMYVLNFIN